MKTFCQIKWPTLNTTLCKIVLASVFIVNGCSDDPTGGISGTGKAGTQLNTGIIVGQLDSLNELSIDGQPFDTTESEVLINGVAASIGELRIGMSVTAKVDYQSKTATSIYYQPLLAGPISTASDDKSTLEILGQTISITEDTFLDELTTEDIFQNNVIEVSGNRSKSETIIAEYVRVPNLSDNFYVVGDLEETSQQMSTIAGTNVDLDSLASQETGQIPEITPGTVIKAEIEDPTPDSSPDTPLIATSAEVVNELKPEKFETVSINGVVSEAYESGNFEIRSFIFSISDETDFFDRSGNTMPSITVTEDMKIKVVGVSSGGNIVEALQITIRQ